MNDVKKTSIQFAHTPYFYIVDLIWHCAGKERLEARFQQTFPRWKYQQGTIEPHCIKVLAGASMTMRGTISAKAMSAFEVGKRQVSVNQKCIIWGIWGAFAFPEEQLSNYDFPRNDSGT